MPHAPRRHRGPRSVRDGPSGLPCRGTERIERAGYASPPRPSRAHGGRARQIREVMGCAGRAPRASRRRDVADSSPSRAVSNSEKTPDVSVLRTVQSVTPQAARGHHVEHLRPCCTHSSAIAMIQNERRDGAICLEASPRGRATAKSNCESKKHSVPRGFRLRRLSCMC